MAETETKEKPRSASGFLGTVEKIGNKLPDPFWLFVILAAIVAVTSWLGHLIGMSAEDPKTGETIEVQSLLTCLLYTSPSPRDVEESRMPSSA